MNLLYSYMYSKVLHIKRELLQFEKNSCSFQTALLQFEALTATHRLHTVTLSLLNMNTWPVLSIAAGFFHLKTKQKNP